MTPTYKHLTDAPVYDGRIGRNWSAVVEPGKVKSLLMRHGYEWQPHARLLVQYSGRMKVGKLLCWVGSAQTKPEDTTLHQLKG